MIDSFRAGDEGADGGRGAPPPHRPAPLRSVDQGILHLSRKVSRDVLWHHGGAARMPGPPPTRRDLEGLLATVAERAPALTYRLSGPPRHARWEPDPHFRPDRHVQHCTVSASLTPYQALLEGLHVPLPRDRPLWSVLVIDGYSDEEYLLCGRTHHGFQDGMGTARLLHAVLAGGPLPHPEPPPVRPWRSLLGGLARTAIELRPRPARRDGRCRPGRHAARSLHTAQLDLAAIREVTVATQATVAQVVLAVLAGAMRARALARTSGSAGHGCRDVRVMMPISLGGRRHTVSLGNQIGLMPVRLPCAEPSAPRRLERVIEQTGMTRLIKARDDQEFLRRADYALTRLMLPWLDLWGRGQIGVTVLSGAGTAIPGAREVFLLPPLPRGVSAVFACMRVDTAVSISCVADSSAVHAPQVVSRLQPALDELRTAVSR